MNEQETYEYLVNYLVENDFVDAENADKIILHMSEEWYADIIESSCGSKPKKVRKKMVTEDEDVSKRSPYGTWWCWWKHQI